MANKIGTRRGTVKKSGSYWEDGNWTPAVQKSARRRKSRSPYPEERALQLLTNPWVLGTAGAFAALLFVTPTCVESYWTTSFFQPSREICTTEVWLFGQSQALAVVLAAIVGFLALKRALTNRNRPKR